MDNKQKIINLYFKSIARFNEIESTPKDFGTGDLLFSSEIHTLVSVGDNPGANLTELSEKMDITKGATSKFLKKLLDKELIVKKKLPDNQKETLYWLTSKGKIAYDGHAKFSKEKFGDIFKMLSELTENESETIKIFLEKLNRIINRHI